MIFEINNLYLAIFSDLTLNLKLDLNRIVDSESQDERHSSFTTSNNSVMPNMVD